MRDFKDSIDDSDEFERINSAARELSDFLDPKNGKIPYSCPNWNIGIKRINHPYVQKPSFSDKYLKMPEIEQTQYIIEEDIPSDIDWSLPPIRKRRWTFAAAFLAAFSFYLYSQSAVQPKVEKINQNYEYAKKPVSKNREPPSFKQDPRK